MINPASEELLALKDAAKTLPGRPHISTIYRWMHRGIDGVRLETVRIGGRRYTSSQALHRFSKRLTDQTSSEISPFDETDSDVEFSLDEEVFKSSRDGSD